MKPEKRAECPWGVALKSGQTAVAAMVDEIVWYDRSPFIAASCGDALPGLTARLRRAAVRGPRTAGPRARGTRSDPARRRVSVTFAPEHNVGDRPWEREAGVPLLAPDRDVVARAGDKTAVVDLCRSVGVSTPEGVVVPAEARPSARRIRALLGSDELVVQRAPNNLIGRGTVPVGRVGELDAALAAWPREPLKVARFQPGLSVTVSACVGADATVVSMVSHQLVGFGELGAGWGTHCGNQLLGAEDLPAGGYQNCRTACHAIGEALRERGFRGVFGIDAVVDADGQVWVIEVNPRFQSVVSLVHAAEVGAGLLPLLGVHVLANLTELRPLLHAGDLAAPRAPGWGPAAVRPAQMVVHATRPGQVSRIPVSGCYRLGADGRLSRTTDRALPDLAEDEALVWAHAHPGDLVTPGDEAVLLQFGRRIATVTPTPLLLDRAQRWLGAVRAELAVRDAVGAER